MWKVILISIFLISCEGSHYNLYPEKCQLLISDINKCKADFCKSSYNKDVCNCWDKGMHFSYDCKCVEEIDQCSYWEFMNYQVELYSGDFNCPKFKSNISCK